ncbi:aspartate aminotransferase family protein [Helicobacter sp. T3_23-1059]
MKTAKTSAILPIYARQEVVFERGRGVYLYDTLGKKYLDFGAGIAVNALGYAHKDFTNALKKQASKLLHISNLYYNTLAIKAANKLAKASHLSKVFFTNSGAEAIEGALKVAKKYAYNKGITHPKIIAFKDSFHGRTLGALSITGNETYQKPFKPLLDWVEFAEFNDIKSVENLIAKYAKSSNAKDSKICAIILEPVQGESGILPAKRKFLRDLHHICKTQDILLILDEIQCGMARSGSMFAYQQYGIMPDILTTAKALGCGVPVGAFVLNQKVAQHSLEKGEHGSTYGGNPFACAAVSKVFDIFEKQKILERVNANAPLLKNALESMKSKYSVIKEVRSMGLLAGLELESSLKITQIIESALKKGLIILPAGKNTLRFAPPLIIKPKHIKQMQKILESVFDDFA